VLIRLIRGKIRLIPNFQETTTLYSEIFLQTKLQGNYFCHFFVISFITKYLIMKKALLITLLNFFLLQNDAFATIQKIPENAVLKPHLSFKQKVFTYFLQKKIRYALAQQPNRIVPKDSSGHDCVQMKLKRGSTIAATIISMDDKTIIYKLCDHPNIAEGTIRLEQVAHVTDANQRIIFNNEPKSNRIGELTKGDKYSAASFAALGIALIAMLLAVVTGISILASSLGGRSNGTETLFFALTLTFVVGMLVSFIAGIAALADMAKTPPQKSGSKFSATLSTILSGLVVLLMLVRFAGL
jgi:hypothetical protein